MLDPRNYLRKLRVGLSAPIPNENLSDLAMRERRNLIAVSFVGALMVLLRLSPSGIPALGISFDGAAAKTPEWIVFFAVVYFLVAFCVYVSVEFSTFKLNALRKAVQEHTVLAEGVGEVRITIPDEDLKKRTSEHKQRAQVLLRMRVIFEVICPVGLGVATALLLLGSILFTDTKGSSGAAPEVIQVEVVGPVQLEGNRQIEAEVVGDLMTDVRIRQAPDENGESN